MDVYDNQDSSEDNIFKQTFKYYKQKAKHPSFDDVIDFNNCANLDVTITYINVPKKIENFGLKPTQKLKLCHFNSIPGLYYITNPFTNEGKRFWVDKCLKTFSKPPQHTNIDETREQEDVWEASLKILSKHKSYTNMISKDQMKLLKMCPIWKLRWATLGYHHNWNTKAYNLAEPSQLPVEMNNLAQFFAKSIGYNDFSGEAAIINYYHAGCCLSPHIDTSEISLKPPLISVSFGLSCIFLIGGDTKDIKPHAIKIQSGDVLIMSGKSRLAYHGVPRIMENEEIEEINNPLDLFLSHSRINMNIRQVHKN